MDHKLERVAQIGNTRIDRCVCGVLHVTVGSITVRLKPDDARGLKEALERALASGSVVGDLFGHAPTSCN
jgi:hypothetical protein